MGWNDGYGKKTKRKSGKEKGGGKKNERKCEDKRVRNSKIDTSLKKPIDSDIKTHKIPMVINTVMIALLCKAFSIIFSDILVFNFMFK